MKYKVIAVDFDGTICKEEGFPGVGEPIAYAKEAIRKIEEIGGTIIIWTCRTDDALKSALSYLKDNDIPFHYVNENCEQMKEFYNNDPRKIGADIYIDDKSIMGEIDWIDISRYIFDDNEFDDFIEQLQE